MRAQRRENGLPYERRQSGDKFRKGRHDDDLPSVEFHKTQKPFGVLLRDHVYKALRRMGIPHRVYHSDQPYARSQRVELAVETEIRSVPMVEFQFTLRHQTRPKIKDFFRAAVRRPHQHVPRVYLEIDHPGELNVEAIGDRVAKTIRDIANAIARRGHAYARESGNVIGLTLAFDAEGRRLEPTPLNLLALMGTEARAYIARTVASIAAARERAYLEGWHRAKEANRQERVARRADRPTLRQKVLFHLRGGHPDVPQPFVPTPAFVATQFDHPLRMPFRR